jgi:hypothetical protein
MIAVAAAGNKPTLQSDRWVPSRLPGAAVRAAVLLEVTMSAALHGRHCNFRNCEGFRMTAPSETLPRARGRRPVDGIPQVEMLDHGPSIGCVVIHVIAFVDLCGTPVTAPVVGYDAVAMC